MGAYLGAARDLLDNCQSCSVGSLLLIHLLSAAVATTTRLERRMPPAAKMKAESRGPKVRDELVGGAPTATAAGEETAELPREPLPAIESLPSDHFSVARMERLREHLSAADVERRISKCVETLLSNPELPVNPFPPLTRLLRIEELDVALVQQEEQLPAPMRQNANKRAAMLWREGELQTSTLDGQLAVLPKVGAAWRPLAPLVDADSARATIAGLASCSQLLASTSRPVGSFTVKTCVALTGAHAFAGRLLARPRTVELLEHVQVRGPGARLDEALNAFAEHICSSALALHASRECLVEELEIYTGEGDVFDDEATAEVANGRTTSGARGTPERFGLAAMHARAPVLSRALQAAAISQLPVYLHVLACVPASEDTGARSTAAGGPELAAAPPRWQFVAVQKGLCFFYEATSASIKTAASSRAAALGVERPVTPPARFQPLQQQSLFQAVWMSDADASWYTKLRENKQEASGGGTLAEARSRFVAFMRAQVCRLLMRGDHLDLLEALLLLLPEVPRDERPALLLDMNLCFTSDAAVLAELAHQSHVLSRVLDAATGVAVPEPKRAYVLGVARRQCAHVATSLRRFCSRAQWADLEPLKPYLLDTLVSLVDDHEQFVGAIPDASRTLRRLRRTCHALHQTLADTLISTRAHVKTQLARIWAATPDLEVPIAIQPPPMRVKVVDVVAERARQRKAKSNPAALANEAVLMQYAVDTGLDRALVASLEAACTAQLLRGNPMYTVLLRVKAAAQYFDLWREPDEAVRAALLNTLKFSDMRHNIYKCNTSASSGNAPTLYVSTQARWGGLSNAAGGQDEEATVASAAVGTGGEDAIYGLRPSILVADNRQLHTLRGLLGDLMPAPKAQSFSQQGRRYECIAHTAYVGDMLLHGRSTTLEQLHSVALREDNFIRGPNAEEALSIHCQHVVQSFLRLHLKTLHIAASLQLGSRRWTAGEVQRDQRGALGETMRALRAGHAPQLHAFALVRVQGATRYIALTKALHVVHFASPAPEGREAAATAWPPRIAQLFDTVFLSQAHVQSCLDAEVTTTDPLQGWRARKWATLLTEQVRSANRGGQMLPACRALLLRSLLLGSAAGLDDVKVLELVPTVGRMLSSAAARLHELGDLARTIHGVLECAGTEEHKLKVDNKALVAMFHTLRVPVVHVLASESAYNFESLRATVQGAFSAVQLDIRTLGVLDANGDGSAVLETIIDYLAIIEVSIANQVVACAPPGVRAKLKEAVVEGRA